MSAEKLNPFHAEVLDYIQKKGLSVGEEVYDSPIEFGIALAREVIGFDEMNVEQIARKVDVDPLTFDLWLKYINYFSANNSSQESSAQPAVFSMVDSEKKKRIALARLITSLAVCEPF